MAAIIYEGALDLQKMLEQLTPYTSPVSPKQFGRLSCNLLFVAFAILAWFIV